MQEAQQAIDKSPVKSLTENFSIPNHMLAGRFILRRHCLTATKKRTAMKIIAIHLFFFNMSRANL